MWDPLKGLKLQTNPKEYPIWFSKQPINLQYDLSYIGNLQIYSLNSVLLIRMEMLSDGKTSNTTESFLLKPVAAFSSLKLNQKPNMTLKALKLLPPKLTQQKKHNLAK